MHILSKKLFQNPKKFQEIFRVYIRKVMFAHKVSGEMIFFILCKNDDFFMLG
jgi:hypothetical protein